VLRSVEGSPGLSRGTPYSGGHFLSLACGLRPEAAPMGVLWPWLAEVHVSGNEVCIGILIAPGWVLAATHCVLRWVLLMF
jgi:hypothetical protein